MRLGVSTYICFHLRDEVAGVPVISVDRLRWETWWLRRSSQKRIAEEVETTGNDADAENGEISI